MTSSVSSRTPPRARLVPTFCTLLLLAALFSPCTVVAAARDAAPGAALDAAHGASGRRRVLQEPLASDEIASAETAALLAFMRAMGSHPAFSLAGRWSNGPSANRQGQLSQPCADTWQFVTCDSSGRVVTIDMSNPLLASLNVSWAKGATREFVAQQLTAQSASPEAVAAAVVTGPLRGEIPWGKMTALQRLERVDLSGNEVTGAAVSAAAALLPGLKHLNLTFNLIDSLPAAVTAMTALESLHLDMNAISGSLPSGLSALTRLSSLVLGQNRIVGQLPEEIGALSSLVNLDLGENYFHGVPPDSWSNLTNLHLLSLYRLHLTAAFPPSWSALASLSSFTFSSSAASGPFPAFLTQLRSIERIYLHSNRLYGPLPSDLWRPATLTYVDLSNNFFNGSVPLPPPERQADFRYFFNCFTTATPSPAPMAAADAAAAEGQLDAATCADFYSYRQGLDAAAAAGTQQPSSSTSTWGSSFFTVCLLIALMVLVVAVAFTCRRSRQHRGQQQSEEQQQRQMRVEVDVDADAAPAEGAPANTDILSPNKGPNQPFLAGFTPSNTSS
ncbi:hypothetical protein CLOM_g8465 [Closterium sp. NIES-68]|nr:hypothetical protein CLOM_g8465 [Closterium sp. NIES-68]GJP69261.1 hypothetical protein CLOP_g205 [Closterium sp. NIES-67]